MIISPVNSSENVLKFKCWNFQFIVYSKLLCRYFNNYFTRERQKNGFDMWYVLLCAWYLTSLCIL